MDKAALKEKAQALQPLVRIGKNGISLNIIGEIAKQLQKHKLVKIKLLRAFFEEHSRQDAAQQIAQATGSEIVQVTGNVVVVYRA